MEGLLLGAPAQAGSKLHAGVCGERRFAMKMLIAVIQEADAASALETLTHCGYRVTRVATQGGWLRRANTTLLIGLNDIQVDHAIKVIKRVAGHRSQTVKAPGDALHGIAPSEVTVEAGGATIFIVDVDRFERL
jgi:uncharacterized protein YaaQ